MNLDIRYPGDEKLRQVMDRIRMVGTSPSMDVAGSLLEDLNRAYELCLSYDCTFQAVEAFATLAGYVTPRQVAAFKAGSVESQQRSRFAERLLAAGRNIWVPLIGLLEPSQRIHVWEAIDNLFAAIVAAHLHEEVVYAGIKHLDQCEFPATATANMLSRRLLSLGMNDKRLVQLVDFLNKNARFPQEMSLARACGAKLDFQLQAASMKRSGAVLEALNQLRSVDDAVTETFGSEFFVDVSGSESREVAEILTKRVLAVKAEWNIRDQFANDYVEFIIGRIDAGAGNPDHAIRVFRQMIRNGFAPVDSSIYLAYLTTSEGRQAESREALESLVATCAVPSDFPEVFGGVFTAYRRAAGDPAQLSRVFPMEELVESCRQSRARIDAEYVERMKDDVSRAVDSFWLSRTEVLLTEVGRALEPGDFDSASTPGIDARTVKLPPEILYRAGIDKMPNLSPIARTTFVEAAQTGVPASELIKQLFEIGNNLAGDFGTMARLVPAWAYSNSIALGRLDDAIKTRNASAVLVILDQYLHLDGVPADLLVTLYEQALMTADKPASIEKMLETGIRFWKTVRGPSGIRILRSLRPAAFRLLKNLNATQLWIPALEAIFDTIPDDETKKLIADWYLGLGLSSHDESAPEVRWNDFDLSVLNSGRVIGERIGQPFDAAVRTHLREMVLAGRSFDARRATAVELNERVELMNEWCAGDPVADRMIVDWFNLWVCSKGGFNAADYDEMADSAFMAISRVSDRISKRDIAETALDILKVRLDSVPESSAAAESVLQRISALSEYVPEASDLVTTHREEQKDSRLLFYAAVFGGAGVVALSILLLLLFAC